MRVYSEEEISKALDIAIASNSVYAMNWVVVHPLSTTRHLKEIVKKKKIPETLKRLVARHDMATDSICDKFRNSSSIELAMAVLGNTNLPLEYRKTWLTDKLQAEAMRIFENTRRYDGWKRRLSDFQTKIPSDVWPYFHDLINVKDILT